MIMIWGFLWPRPQTFRGEEEEENSSFLDSSALGEQLSKEEEIITKVRLLSHNVEMDRMFNRG